jgi:branched-chain amino acid transport system ATP-binding protein
MLEAHRLHTFYGSSHILHGIDFSVAEGEAVALMGRNGTGKTTLIRSMLGLVPPRSGAVQVDGKAVTGSAPFRIARMGIAYIPERRGVFPNLTVRENLLMAARPAVDARSVWTLSRVLETFPRLAERLSHLGTQLSGGEQQMLTISRALMTHPRILLLDEATEGLDKNFAMLSQVAHRCVILVKGRMVFDGSPARLDAEPGLRAQYLGV